MDFDLQNTYQNHFSDENMKWSHDQYEHFAPGGFFQTHDKSWVSDGSVEVYFFKSLGLKFEAISDDLNRFLRQIRWQLIRNGSLESQDPFGGLGDGRKTKMWKGLGVPPVPVMLTQYRKKKTDCQQGWWVQWRVTPLMHRCVVILYVFPVF